MAFLHVSFTFLCETFWVFTLFNLKADFFLLNQSYTHSYMVLNLTYLPVVNFGQETSCKLTNVFRDFHNKDYLLKVINPPNKHMCTHTHSTIFFDNYVVIYKVETYEISICGFKLGK